MQINPAIPSYQTLKPTPQLTPAAQIAMSPAVQAAQQTAPSVRTQTAAAPQATGKSEQTRDARSGTQGGQTVDTTAAALGARVNAQGYRGSARGSLLDLSA
ncbi:hypothetical protein [Azospirillum sp. TSO35-2]|uniref:hypothetical protein n=1 Tax=Azospirillum sp. TSO35-2 TaxID=716796 RepID=UPI000D607F6F|nr:hypothetical protein [Azospirillum sp. TSO35-2]PWC34330.1 hypothetical protein TSO352_29085 [Azospirillum sp. TSO35-2]